MVRAFVFDWKGFGPNHTHRRTHETWISLLRDSLGYVIVIRTVKISFVIIIIIIIIIII